MPECEFDSEVRHLYTIYKAIYSALKQFGEASDRLIDNTSPVSTSTTIAMSSQYTA